MLRLVNSFLIIILASTALGCVSLPESSNVNDADVITNNAPTLERDIEATLEALDQLIIAARQTAIAKPTDVPPTATPAPAPTATPVPAANITCNNRYSPTVPTVYLSSITDCKLKQVTFTWDVEKTSNNYYVNYTLLNESPYDYANGHVTFRIYNLNKTQYVDLYKNIVPVSQSNGDDEGVDDFRELLPNTIATVGELQLIRFEVGDY